MDPRKWGVLLALLLFILPARAWGQETRTPTRTSTRERIEITEEMRAARRIVEPMLERMVSARDTDVLVRIWAMAVQTKLKDIDDQDFIMLPSLLRQLSDRNETVRLTAIQILRRRVLELEHEEWVSILSPMVLEVAKTAHYPEARIAAGKLLGALGNLDEDDLTSVPMLLELTQDHDADSRRNAVEMIDHKIADSLEEKYLRRALTSQAVRAVRTSPHQEVRSAIGGLLAVLSTLDEDQLGSLYLMFDLSTDENEDVRKIFVDSIGEIVRMSRGSVGTAEPRRRPAEPGVDDGLEDELFEVF